MLSNWRWLVLLLLVVVAAVANGCSTTESENVSERPWNAPQGWENGMPAGMYNQHR